MLITGYLLKNKIFPIPPDKYRTMQKSWRAECPISLDELSYLTPQYWGFDHQAHQGVLIVHQTLAVEVAEIFAILYVHRFPIEQMKTMEVFNDDDDLSMAANNTSAFNCRGVTGQPGIFSQHSYGRAIDINPRINPYVKGDIILPLNGEIYVDRNKPSPGKITKESLVYQLFTDRGWDWGGDWPDLQDYHHFEKRANGERRCVV